MIKRKYNYLVYIFGLHDTECFKTLCWKCQWHLIPVRYESLQTEYFTINTYTWFNFIRTVDKLATRQQNKQSQSTLYDVDRCRMMSYAPWRLAVPSKLSFWAPTAPVNSRNATRRMLFLSLLLLLSRRCKAMRTPLSPRSLPTQCRKKGFNATHSLCSTTVFTLGHPVCFKLPLFQWFAHFANLRIPLFERVSAGLRLPCASGCRRLRAEDLQKSANCLG